MNEVNLVLHVSELQYANAFVSAHSLSAVTSSIASLDCLLPLIIHMAVFLHPPVILDTLDSTTNNHTHSHQTSEPTEQSPRTHHTATTAASHVPPFPIQQPLQIFLLRQFSRLRG